MAEEADYEVTIPLKNGVEEGRLNIGFLPDWHKPMVGMHLPNLGLMMLDPDSAKEVARRLLVEADKANGILPSHIYVVDNRE